MIESLLIIPEQFLKELAEKQHKILELLNNKSSDESSYCMTEKQAREIFNRKSIWFWQMRKDGKLPYSKIGKSIYYSSKDLRKMFEDAQNNIETTDNK